MKVRLTVELDIEIDRDEYPNITAEEILKGIKIIDDDGVDGFDILTDIPGYDCTSDFFLKNGVIKHRQLLRDQVQDVDINKLANYIVSEGTQHSENGTWENAYIEFLYHFGVEMNPNDEICKQVVEALKARVEIESVDVNMDGIEVTYYPEYCENLTEPSQTMN